MHHHLLIRISMAVSLMSIGALCASWILPQKASTTAASHRSTAAKVKQTGNTINATVSLVAGEWTDSDRIVGADDPASRRLAQLSLLPPLATAAPLAEQFHRLPTGQTRRSATYRSPDGKLMRSEDIDAIADHRPQRQVTAAGHVVIDGIGEGQFDPSLAVLRAAGLHIESSHRAGQVIRITVPEPSDPSSLPRTLAAIREAGLQATVDTIHWPADLPDDPSLGKLWGMAMIEAIEAWDVTTGDATTLVGILDTGVQINHPDLADNLWVNPGEIPANGIDDDGNGYVDDVHGYDFGAEDSDPNDPLGHGTHVAGTVGAQGNNGIGAVGVMQNVALVACKIASSDDGWALSSDMNRAKRYMQDLRRAGHFVAAYNVSYSAGEDSNDADAYNMGIVPVWAAGNEGRNESWRAHYADEILFVGATDDEDGRPNFSNTGRTWVDLAAPGQLILSTVTESGYANYTGTSMAAPHVAGAVGLIRSRNRSLSTQQVHDIINQTADPVSDWSGLSATGGRLNVRRALQAASGYAHVELAPLPAVTTQPDSVRIEALVRITDNHATAVRFYLNGSLLATDYDSSDGWHLDWTPAEPGIYSISAEVDDNAGRTTSLWRPHQISVVAPPNYAPLARAGDDITVTADDSDLGSIKLDARASTDSDGQIVSYAWLRDDEVIAPSATANVLLPVGTYTLTLVVTDDYGATSSDGIQVTVERAPRRRLTIGLVDGHVWKPEYQTRGTVETSTVTTQIIEWLASESLTVRAGFWPLANG